MAAEEVLGLVEVGGLQDFRVVLEPSPAELPAEQVAHLVAGHGRSSDHADQHGQGELQLLVEEPCGEEQRVARQEREQHTRFDEHHAGDHRHCGRAHALQQRRGVEE